MNRHRRRAEDSAKRTLRVTDPNGARLYPRLLVIEERGPDGRPTRCRISYDEETIAHTLDMKPGDTPPEGIEMLLVWMAQEQGKPQ